MRLTPQVKEILSWYESENPGVKANLARLFMHGKLAGSGKLVILPVDQGFEHGPARSFAPNPAAYDPRYLFELAIEAGLSAYAAPLGPLEVGASTFAGEVPLILKLNSANSLSGGNVSDQALTAIHGRMNAPLETFQRVMAEGNSVIDTSSNYEAVSQMCEGWDGDKKAPPRKRP